MYSQYQLALMRVDRFVGERILKAIYRETAPVSITAWEVPDEPVPFADAVGQTFTSFAIGDRWGRPWSTLWLHITGTVPADWSLDDGRLELVVDLGFTQAMVGFQAEGLVYSATGDILKALEPRSMAVRLDVQPGETFEVYVEAAANPDVGASLAEFEPILTGRKQTAGSAPLYTLGRVAIAILDEPVWELAQDIWTLRGLAAELPADLPRTAEIVAALDRMVDAVDPGAVGATARAGRAILAPVLESPAYASAHRTIAVGHAHIDSAWLWPVRETVRKCARTFSNVLALMDEYPDFVFACSSAQQFAWMKEFYPALFERIRARVIEGRFVPVGGMWVESDTNMPGGEALARQFVEGKSFFLEEFGCETRDVWLPDSFGYTAALPQIARAAGATAFLTQKLSWNEINHFPHNTFLWEGTDGSRILTHFPAVDKYNSDLSAADLAHAQSNYLERGTANTSLVPFGFGDGGGGPTREMLAAAERTHSLEGSPTVTIGTPQQFFDLARVENPQAAVWAGELYLEFHRGTYTSQARTKHGNRRSERLLHEAELWATTATIRAGARYPYDELQENWRTVLLQQFHDILPGTSIGWVHDQAEANYAVVREALESLIAGSLKALTGSGAAGSESADADADADARAGAGSVTAWSGSPGSVYFNASPYSVGGVRAYGASPKVPASGVRAEQVDGNIVLTNAAVRLTIDAQGLFRSIIDLPSGREVVPAGTAGNLLQLFRDTPTQWDAWDVDQEYRRVGVDLVEVDLVELVSVSDVAAVVRVVRTFGTSTIEQRITLTAGAPAIEIETTIDWHESQKLLKLGFPVDVHSDRAASEIQFGHYYRPTHTNTSWDTARFETAAHRWVHVADASFGVGIANDSTYGHDITRTATESGRTYTTIRQSLLRAPIFPDPEADQGRHVRRSSLVVGGIPAAIEEGYRLGIPLRQIAAAGSGSAALPPIVSSDNPAVVIETVKFGARSIGRRDPSPV